jgi:hypothetical protein
MAASSYNPAPFYLQETTTNQINKRNISTRASLVVLLFTVIVSTPPKRPSTTASQGNQLTHDQQQQLKGYYIVRKTKRLVPLEDSQVWNSHSKCKPQTYPETTPKTTPNDRGRHQQVTNQGGRPNCRGVRQGCHPDCRRTRQGCHPNCRPPNCRHKRQPRYRLWGHGVPLTGGEARTVWIAQR